MILSTKREIIIYLTQSCLSTGRNSPLIEKHRISYKLIEKSDLMLGGAFTPKTHRGIRALIHFSPAFRAKKGAFYDVVSINKRGRHLQPPIGVGAVDDKVYSTQIKIDGDADTHYDRIDGKCAFAYPCY